MLVKATKYDKSTANKGTTTNKGNSGGTAQENKPPQNKGTNVPNGYSQNDIQLMANAVYGESRGEPYLGQVAVAAVILNRVTSASFPNTVSGVIFEPRAFTAVADGQIYLTPNETAKKAVLDAINGWDQQETHCIISIQILQQVNGFGLVHKLKRSGNIFSVNRAEVELCYEVL